MKQAAFITQNPANIKRVYPQDLQQTLRKELFFVGEVWTFEDIIDHPDALNQVEYVFSTWGMPHMTQEQIRRHLPAVKAVFYAAGSVQMFAHEFLECGIAVFSAWAANAVPVAEMTLAQILLANNGYYQSLHRAGQTEWKGRSEKGKFPGNYDINVGIIGAGMIGKLVIEKLKDYRIQVLVFDPFLSEETAQMLGVRKVEQLPDLFEQCQVISNHLANNAQTVGMINDACFSRMKPNATFINTGRGAQVVEEDLIRALKEEPGRVALLDVTYPEPPVEGSPFYEMENVFLTPHIAGSLGQETWRMAEYMYEEYKIFDAGLPTRYGVTKKMLETMA